MKSSAQMSTFVAALLVGIACGPPSVAEECIVVDEQLGYPADRQWCDGEFHPRDVLTWNGQPAGSGLPLCLPPESDGTCQVCPAGEVSERVEAELLLMLPQWEPECQLEHWELGCMRTKASAQEVLGNVDDYCCFEVALWGPGCEEEWGSP